MAPGAGDSVREHQQGFKACEYLYIVPSPGSGVICCQYVDVIDRFNNQLYHVRECVPLLSNPRGTSVIVTRKLADVMLTQGFRLTKPREIDRENVRKYGHPKKLK